MLQGEEHIMMLLKGYTQNSLHPGEIEELFRFLKENPEKANRLLKELTEPRSIELPEAVPLNPDVSHRMLNGLLEKMNTPSVVTMRRGHVSFHRRWVAVAALLLIAVSTFWLISRPAKLPVAQQIFSNPQHSDNDALPGIDGAVLTTADGSHIILDSITNGIVTKEGQTNVIKHSDQLIYHDAQATQPVAEIFNTLTTLKGRKFQLVLADGSKVWLDAASSITYPIAFKGDQRKVSVTGQVYFEVAKDAGRPFIVEARGINIQVLGTHFNVNAYEDESNIKTTLLEGSIKITNKSSSSFLKPGQQAIVNQISGTGTISLDNAVDLVAVMAWKNGFFQFSGADLPGVLRQLSRWYDMEIVYEGVMPQREFEGKIGRDLNLSQVLKLLEKLQVRFRIDGKKLLVQP